MVIETAPRLGDGTPFPTTWWLTCKTLCSALGRLESGGWMAALNRRLAEDEALRAALADAAELYDAPRRSRGYEGPAGHPGGGPDRVRCLHAHVAHYLATGQNEVGRMALDHAGHASQQPCVEPPPSV